MKRTRLALNHIILLIVVLAVATGWRTEAAEKPGEPPSIPTEAISAYKKAIYLNTSFIETIDSTRIRRELAASFIEDASLHLKKGNLRRAEKAVECSRRLHESQAATALAARIHMAQGRWNEAAEELARLERECTDPLKLTSIRRALARSLEEAGREKEAARLYAELLLKGVDENARPTKPSVRERTVKRLIARAKLAIVAGNYVRAERALKAALGIRANSSLLCEIGRLYKQVKKTKQACKAFALAARLDEGVCSRLAADELAPSIARTLFEMGVEEFARKKWSRALEAFERADMIYSTGEILYNMANTLVKLGRREEAIEKYTKAISMEPGLAEAHINLAVLYIKKELYELAKERLKEAIRTAPSKTRAYDLLARLALQEDDEKEAVRLYMEAMTAASDPKAAAAELHDEELKKKAADAFFARCKVLVKEGRFQETVKDVRALTALRPDDPKAWFMRGNVALSTGGEDEAVESYERAIELAPSFPECYNNLGNIHMKRGRLEEARRCFTKAIEGNPGYAQAYNNLGICLRKMGRLREAIEYYKKALKIKPDYAAAYFNLGNAYAELGKS